MAKKTNKTEHVLNLLMSRSEAAEDDIEQAAFDSRTQASAKAAANPPAQSEVPAPSQARSTTPSHHVTFVDSLQSEDHPVSNAIRESLEREAIEMGLLPPNPAGVTEAADSTLDPIETTVPPLDTVETAAPVLDTTETTASVSDSTEATNPPLDTAETTTPPPDAAAAQEPPLPSYRFINVMEDGVAESLMEYMTKLGVCTCDRCKKDVTALALSNLPPKYIVVDAAAVSPLLNFYRNKYSSYIMAELTKACFAVIANPRH